MKKVHAIRVFLMTMVISVMMSAVAFAGAQDFVINNETGHHIIELYVSETHRNYWDDDILGRDVLLDGESTVIEFSPRDNTRYWDLRVVYDDGIDDFYQGLDLYNTYAVTLYYDGSMYVD